MNDRDLILGRIRHSLELNRGFFEEVAAPNAAPELRGPFTPSNLSPLDQFTAELEALQGHVHHCAMPEQALAKLHDLLVSHEAESVLHWDPGELPVPGVGEMLADVGIASADGHVLETPDRSARIQALEPVPICVSGADAAVAESGSIVVVSGPGRGRLASLIAPVHIALLPAERIVRTLPDAFDLLYAQFGRDVVHERANITIITGPSRSADIEQTLTLGVHGPKEIHVIVFHGHAVVATRPEDERAGSG